MRIAPTLALPIIATCGSATERELLQAKGSDTMVNLVQAWAEEFELIQHEVSVAVTGGGSGTGIAALVQGTTDIANASRPVADEESREALERTGKEIVEHEVALDALTVLVHPDNPIAGLSFDELACIYGEAGTCDAWQDLGVAHVPDCARDRIVRIGRQSNSGTAQYFRETVLGPGHDFRLGSLDLNGSSEAVRLVANTPCAIAYVGLGYVTADVKPLCISIGPGEPCVAPTRETAATRAYPLSRSLLMLTLGPPSAPAASFLAWVRSPAGIAVLEATGYVAPAHDAEPP